MRGALIAGLLVLTGAGAATDFYYDPKPRWAEDPDTDVVCDAIRAECKGILKDDKIEGEWSYAELYDADGMLVGVRSLKSTGCKPLDEHMLLGERHFTQVFTKAGQPDLDNISVELAPGTPKDAIRLVKRGTTQVSFGC
jgi:hypothetical protein